jgi:putative Mn2+ efflux pump MntP
MIHDDLRPEHEEGNPESRISYLHLLTLAIATSIDALAVGVGLLFLPSVISPALTIGLVTFTLSLAGVLLGHRYRSLASKRAKMVGGIILILIGAKILAEHLGLWGG